MSNEKTELPDLLAILAAPLLEQSAPEEHRILLAVLERMAAEHYRTWAEMVEDPSLKQGLLAAARREEEIAEIVESLDPRAQSIAQSLLARFPAARVYLFQRPRLFPRLTERRRDGSLEERWHVRRDAADSRVQLPSRPDRCRR